jgi:hypothetical protein
MTAVGLDLGAGAVLLIALLNPAVIAVAFFRGRRADEWHLVVVGLSSAAFMGMLVGSVLIYGATQVGIAPLLSDHAVAGISVFEYLFGLVWAWLGYRHAQWQL